MRVHKIAAIGGDGIGPEVINAGLQALAVCAERDGGFSLDVAHFDWGSDYYRKRGVMMPPTGPISFARLMRSISARSALLTFPITSPSGGFASRFASRSISTRMCARRAFCLASRVR